MPMGKHELNLIGCSNSNLELQAHKVHASSIACHSLCVMYCFPPFMLGILPY
ncbi:hypothetical protein RchiOBHm_Chr5g0003341 [Rosa chinensis]|uniref:Uncharacterized protein n=1 Tax=Rosa chinensis TaxID=74649 RepID=A0A2P6Q2Q0_ROSCH|nr:hypothetical protein RchiOBHm_Chr5g0003341 [Rosa chinensis]